MGLRHSLGKHLARHQSSFGGLPVPRMLLDLPSNSPLDFEFKGTDNMPVSGNILDFYLYGDVAPGGRFNYRRHAS